MQLREQDLGAAFAAGRAAVRGALAHLVEDGLIERGRRRGTTVMDFAGACRSDDGTGFRIAGHLLDGSDIDEESSWCRRRTLSSAPMAVDPVTTSVFGGCSVLIVTESVVEIETRTVELITEYRREPARSAATRHSRALYAAVFGAGQVSDFGELPTSSERHCDIVSYATLADGDLAAALGIDSGAAVLIQETTTRGPDGDVQSLAISRRPGMCSARVTLAGGDRNGLPSRTIG